jgi:hypothetical protein
VEDQVKGDVGNAHKAQAPLRLPRLPGADRIQALNDRGRRRGGALILFFEKMRVNESS